MRSESPKDKGLVVTLTNEPFQPVRLFYAIPDRAFVLRKLRQVKCVVEVPEERCWHWLFEGESASLRFVTGYDEIPKERRPVLLGRLHFPKSGGMRLQTSSVLRAIAAARFFAPRLGPEVVATRCRVVNRCFTPDEGDLDELMRTLDQGVTVIDPRVAEAAMEQRYKGARTMEDLERAATADLERRIRSKEDVPMVEDFPLAPEEETPDFQHLETALQLRLLRAMEHWRGNHRTLTEIILEAVKDGAGPGNSMDG